MPTLRQDAGPAVLPGHRSGASPTGFSVEATASGGDAARLQRAPEGPGQSPGGRGNQGVQGGRVRLVGCRVGAVVLGHGAVHPEVIGRSSAGTVAVRSGPWCRVTVTCGR